jgi:hypothetical protein
MVGGRSCGAAGWAANTACASVAYINSTMISCVTAACSGVCSGPVTMFVYNQALSGPTFTYVANPTVSSVTPSIVRRRLGPRHVVRRI